MVGKIGKIWYMDFYHKGLRVRKKISLATRKDACAYEHLFELQQQALVKEEQLILEVAETLVQLEIAGRRGAVIAEEKEVYSDNPEAFELERLRLMAELFGTGTVYFIPEGTELTSFFNVGGTTVLPVSAGD